MRVENDGVPTAPLGTLAMELEQVAQAHAAQMTKARLEAEWRTKRQPTRAQAEPVGLFEQRQETLGL